MMSRTGEPVQSSKFKVQSSKKRLRTSNFQLRAARRGLTLVEVLVSLVILSVGAVTILQAMVRISHAQALAAYQSKAYLVALSKLGDVEVAFREGRDVEASDTGTVRIGEHAFQWDLASTSLVGEPLVRVVSLAVRWRAGTQTFQRRFETQLRLPAPGNNP